MKHTFAYLCALLAMTATTPDKAFAQTQVSPFVPGSTVEGVCYYLPRTALRIVVTAEREIQSPGELNQYAFKYMRINDALSEASERWSITDIQLHPYGVPDRAKAYSIALRGRTVAPLVSLSREGIILGINADITETQLPAPPQGKSAPERRDPRKLMNREMLQVTSPSKLAELVAQEIYDIRESRNALIRGEADNTPKDGEQLKLMISKLDEQEEAYTGMFCGTIRKYTHVFTLEYIPEAQHDKDILFRFSSKLGPLAADDFAGEPVYVSVKCAETLPQAVHDERADAKKEKMQQGVHYNVPVLTNIDIFTPQQKYATLSVPMAQFGRTEILSNTLFDKKTTTQVTFFQSTGAVKDVVE